MTAEKDQTAFSLDLQLLARGVERVLVLADLAAATSGNGVFTVADLRTLFDSFQVPAPRNLSRDVRSLEQRGLLIRRLSGAGLSITPVGRETARQLLPAAGGERELSEASAAAAKLGGVDHNLLPYELAPAKWRQPIRDLTARSRFEDNVFVMTRFPRARDEDDSIARAIGATRHVLEQHSLNVHVASDRALDPDLFGNVAGHMWACAQGVAFFERRAGYSLNENLLVEVGAMLMTGRRCALLRDRTVKRMPTDFVGQIYKPVDLNETSTIERALHEWARDDLNRGACPGCGGRND